MIDLSSVPPPSDPQVAKYLDAGHWLAVAERRLRDLSLPPASRILDIGTGCGYFPFVARAHGHEVTAIDRVGRDPFYCDVTALLGIDVIERDVLPLTPLGIAGEFDAITAYMITFNGHRVKPWGVAEWRFFLDDMPPARVIHLELNREPDGTIYPPGVRELFLSRGATIDKHRVTFR